MAASSFPAEPAATACGLMSASAAPRPPPPLARAVTHHPPPPPSSPLAVPKNSASWAAAAAGESGLCAALRTASAPNAALQAEAGSGAGLLLRYVKRAAPRRRQALTHACACGGQRLNLRRPAVSNPERCAPYAARRVGTRRRGVVRAQESAQARGGARACHLDCHQGAAAEVRSQLGVGRWEVRGVVAVRGAIIYGWLLVACPDVRLMTSPGHRRQASPRNLDVLVGPATPTRLQLSVVRGCCTPSATADAAGRDR